MAIRNNKLGGNNWDDERLYDYDLNDTFDGVIDEHRKLGIGVAQNAYQTLQSNNIFENKDFLAADEFVTETGTNNTKTGGTTLFNGDKYILNITDEAPNDTTYNPDSFTNPNNAFDNDASTYAERTNLGSTRRFGKTFNSKLVPVVIYKLGVSDPSNYTITVKLETYDGSNWTTVDTIYNNKTTSEKILTGTFILNSTVQGIRVTAYSGGFDDSFIRVYSLEYGGFNSSGNLICSTNIITLDGTEKILALYSDNGLPTGTNITVDVTDGTNTISNQPINTIINISSLSSGDLGLTFNLSTTDNTATPYISGFGVYKQ